jgi:SpoVK/Ycf46/Vps4 family AAA+-type ATPase
MARKRMFELNLKEKPLESIDYEALAKATEGFSAADIKKVTEETSDKIFRQALRTNQIVKITTQDILSTVAQSKPTTLEWFMTVKSYITYSNQTGLYDEVKKYMDAHKI